MTNAEMVEEFHLKFGYPIVQGRPRLLERGPHGEGQFRFNLMHEELDEYSQAVAEDNLVKIADALADLLYVVYGTAITHGIPIDEVFAEVHRSNMTKEPSGSTTRKVIKGPDYSPPDIEPILRRAG